jgi:hypothetical protein
MKNILFIYQIIWEIELVYMAKGLKIYGKCTINYMVNVSLVRELAPFE